MDDKDGDITKDIVVESIGPFLSDKTRTVTYVVCDSSFNTSRISRSLTYKDYVAPGFELDMPMRFVDSAGEDPLNHLTASDCIDGDLTKLIRQSQGEYHDYTRPGIYYETFNVSNSAGDMVKLKILVEVYSAENAPYSPRINLVKNNVIVKKGKSFDPYAQLKNVTIGGRTYKFSSDSKKYSAKKDHRVEGLYGDLSNREKGEDIIEIIEYSDLYLDNPVKTDKRGSYLVTYQITTKDGYSGIIGLPVQVY